MVSKPEEVVDDTPEDSMLAAYGRSMLTPEIQEALIGREQVLEGKSLPPLEAGPIVFGCDSCDVWSVPPGMSLADALRLMDDSPFSEHNRLFHNQRARLVKWVPGSDGTMGRPKPRTHTIELTEDYEV